MEELSVSLYSCSLNSFIRQLMFGSQGNLEPNHLENVKMKIHFCTIVSEKMLLRQFNKHNWQILNLTSDIYELLFSFAVRLVGGASNKQGLVQVYYNNNWHWVCGEQWDKHDSNVTCQWLGYSGSSEAYTDTARDGANGTTWMTNVNCTGDERSLFSCVHDGWLGGSCASNQMAGVRCTGPEGNTNLFL